MKNKSLLFVVSLISTNLIADNFRAELVIPGVNIDNPFWRYANRTIHQSSDQAFAMVVEKWNNKIEYLWDQLNYKVIQELGISAVQIDLYLNNSVFVEGYMSYYKHWLPEIIENDPPQEVDPVIVNFIQAKMLYLQAFKKPQINTHDIQPSIFSFGTDKQGHYLILNEDSFSVENIQSLYNQVAQRSPVFIIRPYTSAHQSSAIEATNLVHFDITRAVSNIIHQSDFFGKILQFFLYNNESLSDELQRWGCQYLLFQSLLESILQSKNPVEVAIFAQPQLDNFHFDFILLFEEFLQDLKDCYDQNDLQAYQLFALSECRKDLYSQDDEQE